MTQRITAARIEEARRVAAARLRGEKASMQAGPSNSTSSPWRKWSAPQPREIALRSKAGSRVGPR